MTTTNTLIITGLKTRGNCQPCLEHIKGNLSRVERENLTYSACLSSLLRVVLVFRDKSVAREAFESISDVLSKGGEPRWQDIRVSFSEFDTRDTDKDKDRLLQVPSRGRLMFISPPPSPPPGWNLYHQEEDPPNQQQHQEKEDEDEFAMELSRRLHQADGDEPIQLAESSSGHKIVLDSSNSD